MKKILLISLLIFTVILVGCEEKKIEVISSGEIIENNVETIEETTDVLNMSFEDRTKEAVDFMNQEDTYGIGELWYISNEHYVSNASLEKKDDYYVMKLQMSASMIFDKDEIEKACELAKENGQYVFGTFYTFYSNIEDLIATQNYSEMAKERIKGIENGIFAIDKEYDYDQLCAFIPTPNDSSKYICADITYAGADGFVKTEIEKEIEVDLLPSDVIRILPTNKGDFLENDDPTIEDNLIITYKDVRVEDFYRLAVDNIIASDDADYSIYGFQYNLNSIGDSQGYYGGYVSAVNFDDGRIIVNYKVGGV